MNPKTLSISFTNSSWSLLIIFFVLKNKADSICALFEVYNVKFDVDMLNLYLNRTVQGKIQQNHCYLIGRYMLYNKWCNFVPHT